MENLIMLDVEGNTKFEVIEHLAKRLYKENKIKDLTVYLEAVKEREAEITTGFGYGVAIPHGKSDTVNESCFVLAKLKNQVDWDSMDKKPVDLVFLLAIPTAEAGTTHLRLLSDIAVSIMEEDFVENLRNAKSVEETDMILKNTLTRR